MLALLVERPPKRRWNHVAPEPTSSKWSRSTAGSRSNGASFGAWVRGRASASRHPVAHVARLRLSRARKGAWRVHSLSSLLVASRRPPWTCPERARPHVVQKRISRSGQCRCRPWSSRRCEANGRILDSLPATGLRLPALPSAGRR